MKNHMKKYREELESSIGEYMERPACERSAEAVKGMIECWDAVRHAEKELDKPYSGKEFTHEDAENWASWLQNDDGTTGPHWTIEQTTSVAKNNGVVFDDKLSDWCWWIAMNMLYSDYSTVAEKYKVSTGEFYSDMAKAFLFDKDGPGPMEKLCGYFYGIVKW